MTVSVNTSGTQVTTVGTAEHSLATLTTPAVYQLVIDGSALDFADWLFILEYIKVRSGDGEILLAEYPMMPYAAAQGFITPPRPTVHQTRYAIVQRAGVSRSIPWAVHQQDAAFAQDSSGSQSTTIGTEHTLATLTAAQIYSLQLDLSALVGGSSGDQLLVREYIKTTSGGTERLLQEYAIRGAQVQDGFMTIPRMSAASLRYAICQYEGASRSIPWSVFEL